MTALEIRLIGYALAAIFLLGGAGWIGHRITANHYEALIAADKLSRDQALQAAQQRVIDAQNAQQAAQTTAETEHELRTQADAASRSSVLDGLRDLQSAVHRRILSPTVADPGSVSPAQSGAGSDERIARFVEHFDSSLDRFIAACQSIDNDRTAIISLEPVTH